MQWLGQIPKALLKIPCVPCQLLEVRRINGWERTLNGGYLEVGAELAF